MFGSMTFTVMKHFISAIQTENLVLSITLTLPYCGHLHPTAFPLRPLNPTGSLTGSLTEDKCFMLIIFTVQCCLFFVMKETGSSSISLLCCLHFSPVFRPLITLAHFLSPCFTSGLQDNVSHHIMIMSVCRKIHFPFTHLYQTLDESGRRYLWEVLDATGHHSIVTGSIMEQPAGRLQGEWGCLSQW